MNMIHKKFIQIYFYMLICYLHVNTYSSGPGIPLLIIKDLKTNKSVHHSAPFEDQFMGRVVWNNTRITLLIISNVSVSNCDNAVEIMNADDSCEYTKLPHWGNGTVNAYLIPWPLNPTNDMTNLLKPTEGENQSIISKGLQRVGLEKPKLLIGNFIGENGQAAKDYPDQICPTAFANIFYNKSYFIICYNQQNFEITNIPEINGFPLNLDQRKSLNNSTLYSWEYKGNPIEITILNKQYTFTLTPQTKDTKKDSKDHSRNCFFKRLLSYKWLLLCCAGILGVIIMIKSSAQSR